MDSCIFCNKIKSIKREDIIYEDFNWIAFLDEYPVSEGHTLLIPKRHCETIFDLNDIEKNTFFNALNTIKFKLKEIYGTNDFNVGCNCGELAGQTVMHCHIHIIPRYEGDCENPRGGIRGCIPNKMKY